MYRFLSVFIFATEDMSQYWAMMCLAPLSLLFLAFDGIYPLQMEPNKTGQSPLLPYFAEHNPRLVRFGEKPTKADRRSFGSTTTVQTE